MLKNILLVGLGGGVGSILRYLASYFTVKSHSGLFPLSTFTVNIIGCFLIGILMGFILKSTALQEELRLLLVVGFCGGFTTFSAFSYENLKLWQSGEYWILILYTLLSVLIGLLMVWLGNKVIR
ncbi:fluoride efflux transporter CrcB [Paludibacteraceae bacterium OttesenSCG-928-F17]|nr:fluoride efflux transporter CrcB [Paludibacteraceae bacterium OttesenSCG-928-F17]